MEIHGKLPEALFFEWTGGSRNTNNFILFDSCIVYFAGWTAEETEHVRRESAHVSLL